MQKENLFFFAFSSGSTFEEAKNTRSLFGNKARLLFNNVRLMFVTSL